MEILILLALCIFFPGLAVIVVAAFLVVMCWPLIPILAMLGSMVSSISRNIKS